MHAAQQKRQVCTEAGMGQSRQQLPRLLMELEIAHIWRNLCCGVVPHLYDHVSLQLTCAAQPVASR
jgi:hypothetical protein